MPKRKRGGAIVPAALPGATEHMKFLINHFAPKIASDKRASVARDIRNNWSDISAGNEGLIQNETAKKYNNNYTAGIGSATYTRGSGGDNFYRGIDNANKTLMTLAPRARGKVKDGPRPQTVTHELVHANDHQIDHLNPLVWGNIGALAKTGGGRGGRIKDFPALNNSLLKIRDKIDPSQAFSGNYPFNQNYIEHEMKGAKGANPLLPYAVHPPTGAYRTPITGIKPNWNTLFGDINSATSTPITPGGIPNPGFFLNQASEYPAYMVENLTNRWDANIAPNPLSLPEARFLHSTLGNMANVYPDSGANGVNDYPTMNHHILQRKNSLEQAYYPPTATNPAGGPLPGAPFSYGGHVKVKKKNHGLSYYLGV